MNRAQLDKLLSTMQVEPGPQTGAWLHVCCPLAPWTHESGSDSDPSFGFKLGTPGDPRVHCFACNFSGTASTLLVTLQARRADVDWGAAWAILASATEDAALEAGAGTYEEELLADPPPPHVYPEELLDMFEPAYLKGIRDSEEGQRERFWVVHPYLDERRVPYEVAEQLGLLWDPYRYRILFPVRDFESRLRGLHGRHIGGDWPYAADDVPAKYKMYPYDGATNPHVWLGEAWVDLDRTVLVAESVFDLARCLEVYDNVVTPLTASLSQAKIQRMEGAPRIVTLFDADKAGYEARKRLRFALPGSRITDVDLDPGRDAADYHPDELREALEGYVEV